MTSAEKTAYRRTPHWKARRDATLERDQEKCRLCGKKSRRNNIHHMDKNEPYDSDSIDQLVVLCKRCHLKVAHGRFLEPLQSTILSMLKGQGTEEI